MYHIHPYEITNDMLPNQVWGQMVTKKKFEPSWNLRSEILSGVVFSDGEGPWFFSGISLMGLEFFRADWSKCSSLNFVVEVHRESRRKFIQSKHDHPDACQIMPPHKVPMPEERLVGQVVSGIILPMSKTTEPQTT